MMKLIRLIGLISQSAMLLVFHLVGIVAIVAGFAVGYFRKPSWLVPILAVAFGVGTDLYVDISDVTGLLQKASAASERGGFLILVYFVMIAFCYVIGAYARHNHEKMKAKSATTAAIEKK